MTAEPLRSDTLEELLLQAGLCEPDLALRAWNEFCEQCDDVEALNNCCYRLFPMVAKNLGEFESTLSHNDYLQSTLKHSWAQSKSRFSCVLPLLVALQNEKMDFLVLKSLALSPLYFKHWGSRPMKDMGLLIYAKDMNKAFQVMRHLDWVPRRGAWPKVGSEYSQLESETIWEHPIGVELQMQWRVAPGCFNQSVERNAWASAEPCALPGLEAKTLAPTYLFFHTCLVQTESNPDEAVPRLADSAAILKSGKIDWAYLDELTTRFEQIAPVREIILRLGPLNLGMPGPVLAHWREIKASPLEQLEKGFRVQPMVRRWKIKQSALTYLRLNQGASVGVLCGNIWAYMNQLDDLKGILRRIVLIWYVIRWNRLRN